MKKIFFALSIILIISCNSQGGNVSTKNDLSNNSEISQTTASKPQTYFINEKTAAKIYRFTTAAFLNGSYPSNTLDNCILELELTKHFNNQGDPFYDFYYYSYPQNANKSDCTNTIGITLYNIYKLYTYEQLDKMLNKKLYVYAPSINYNPVRTDNLIDYDCGTYSSIDVYEGWKFIDNIKDYETIEPQLINK